MTPPGPFEEALARLAAVFRDRRVPYALIGGLAVAAWGAPRATEDIDALADLAPGDELDAVLRAAGFEPEWRRGEPEDPIPLLLRLRSASGPEVDVLCATRTWEKEILARAVRLRIAPGQEVPVVAVEDLVVLKLLAGGPRDLADVAELVDRAGPLPALDARAAERGVLELLRRVRSHLG